MHSMADNTKKKVIVIYGVSTLILPFLIFLKKWYGYKIYFIEREKIERINYLETIGIKWIKKEYKDFSQYTKGTFQSPDFAAKIYTKVKCSRLNLAIDALLLKNEAHRMKIDVMWKYYIFKGIENFADLYAAAEYLNKTGRYGSVTVVSFNSLAHFLKDSLKGNIKSIYLPGSIFGLSFKAIACKIKSVLTMPFKKAAAVFYKKETIREVDQNASASLASKPFNPEAVNIAYFPHQGIYYGDLFIKDHYYSEDKNSPFLKEKILHISLGEKNAPHMAETYKYYIENDIPFIDINDIGYSKKELIGRILTLIKRMNVGCITDLFRYGFWYLVYGFLVYTSIERYRLIFSRFTNLRIVLLGYDYLFPRNLSMALSILDVKICATQERLAQAFMPDNYYIFDYYFVAGKAVKERGLKNSHIDYCIPSGMVREDLLYDYEQRQMYDEKYDTIKKHKKLVLALDYHMPSDIVDDFSRPAAKIKQTRQFYRDLMHLAQEYPSLYIVIKGKFVNGYDSHFISDIVEEIRGFDNIEIEQNLKRYDPYFLSEKADLTIACYTSLCDELLAADRKVIFYETTDYMNTILNYDNIPIIVYDYKGLKGHVENFLKGCYLEPSKTKRLKEEFYNNCFHGNVRKNINDILEKLVSNATSPVTIPMKSKAN